MITKSLDSDQVCTVIAKSPSWRKLQMEVKVVLIYSEENGLLLLFISKFDRKECFSNDASIVTVFQDNTIVVMCPNS